jgi:hypothetical protein
MVQDTGLDGFEPDALAAASRILGLENEFGLPYPPMPAPPYLTATGNRWRFDSVMIPAGPGYFGPHRRLVEPTQILARDGVAWMSLMPNEVESQQPHLAAASGTVVICGLGLGLMAYATAARRAVGHVVVVERDPEVVAMFREFAQFDRWPHRGKVELVISDALEFRRGGVDFLYVDIWPFYRMDVMVPDMKRIHANVPAPRCGYWGQELDMIDAALADGVALADFGADHVRGFADRHGLPLIGLEQPCYPDLCRNAAANPANIPKRIPLEEPAARA